jgi:hypothetical protein
MTIEIKIENAAPDGLFVTVKMTEHCNTMEEVTKYLLKINKVL